jgi:hypothetical protein
MDRDQTYFESFLKTADRYRFCTEVVSIPRQKTTLFAVNTKEEIFAGHKTDWLGRERPLKRLDSYGWSNGKETGTPFNAFRNSIHRRDDSKLTKRWFLVTYPEESYVSSFQLDLDLHYDEGMTSFERDEIDHQFKQNVIAIREMAEEVGFDIVWTTSPGNLIGGSWSQENGCWEGGNHVQGLYAWIKLEKPVKVKKLRKYVTALKEFYGIECEASVDVRNHPVRLPGQRYVELVDPETMEILHPAEKPAHTLSWFAEAWHAAKPANLKALFEPAVAFKKKQSSIVSPRSFSSKTVKNVHVEGCSSDDALLEKNTFKAATDRRICSRITIKYQGQPVFFDQAVEEAKLELFSVRPSSSKTCRNPHLLHATCKRWMDYYFSTFDSSRCLISRRDKDDVKRFSSSDSLDLAMLVRFLKDRFHLSFRECSIVRSVFEKMQIWKGRIYCKVLYELAGGRRSWLALKKKLQGYLVITDEWEMKKCRQYGWGQRVLDGLSSMRHASKQAAELLVCVEEECKKRVLVQEPTSATHNSSLEYAPMLIASISSDNHANSYEFT